MAQVFIRCSHRVYVFQILAMSLPFKQNYHCTTIYLQKLNQYVVKLLFFAELSTHNAQTGTLPCSVSNNTALLYFV